MANSAEEMELLLEEYLDGSLDDSRKSQLEARLRSDPELRQKLETATHSLSIIRKALIKVDPSETFEDKVSSQIISITQSNQSLAPAARVAGGGKLTAKDPDAKLIHDPEAQREQRRLMLLAGVAAVVFALAVAAIFFVALSQDEGRRTPSVPPAVSPQ